MKHTIAPSTDTTDYFLSASKTTVFLAIILPFIGFIGCAIYAWNGSLGIPELSVFIALYVLTTLGITVGFHRLFTHRSFQTIAPVRWFFAAAGSMAFEGSLLSWVSTHRRHHQLSDKPGDPHSPNVKADGVIGTIRAFLHSHIGWLFANPPEDQERYVSDLMKDPIARATSRGFIWYAIAGLLIPAVICGLIHGSWMGAWYGFLWGGLCRVFLVHHVTWSINSACHLWGAKPHECEDQSRNNWLIAIPSLGEGWHNNHHAFPTSARHGLQWWQVDVSYYVIVLLKKLRLAWDIRLPATERLQVQKS